ncbi:LysM peptidoglycan-binding domain-containing protein [Evansella cellulosilytica]|uniref:Cell wall hydrolase SleB n=1 Tax=Evansella cellulosilytica (strain ATCC 21833 / DSM 2522 / FERM P-1141 / JCM 9156 / N-4) TaxID=649639 RepID=E6TQJ0_EVAC2|nr:LysM peptidoglycan-binding domain-containing protein [Evansella cellulosilytica]ADU30501.1 cell wall hydrolase SleB [Evansella cellulosilytica DSM 2522]
MMNIFTHYKINQTIHGAEVILYLNNQLEEFSKELGSIESNETNTLKSEANHYVKEKLPNLKITAIKVMSGAILVATMAFAPIKPTVAEASNQLSSFSVQATYTVKAGDSLSKIAAETNTTVDAIRSANQLTSDLIRVGQTLTIPGSHTGVQTNAPQQTSTYTVVAGDSLSTIAARNGTTVAAIRNANQLTSDLVRVGQTLTIPGASTGTQSNAPQETFTYTVVAGDSLSTIAARNGTTVAAIRNANQLTSDLIRVGQTLTIPGASTGTQSNAPQETFTYTVVAGDSLSTIAARNGTTVAAIRNANQLTSDLIRVGQTLTIPGASTPHSTPTQVSEQVNQEDLLWLAKMIFAEARGESLQGQIAVGAVIMNRVKSNLFPNTIQEVLFERSHGHFQFSPAGNGTLSTANPNNTNMEAARRALNGEDPTNGSLYFYNPSKTNDQWVRSRTVSTTIGNHVFAF